MSPNSQTWDRVVELMLSLAGDRRQQLVSVLEKVGAAMARAGHGADWIAENMAELADKFVDAAEDESIRAAAERALALAGDQDVADLEAVELCEDDFEVMFYVGLSDGQSMTTRAQSPRKMDRDSFDSEDWRYWRLRFTAALAGEYLRQNLSAAVSLPAPGVS